MKMADCSPSRSLISWYKGNSIDSGLETVGDHFTLNGKPFRILSGSLHYFRVLPQYWKDRILKMKACGLNTVCTYVPWNLHEVKPGVFDFDAILDLERFLEIINDADMFAIVRPGPYICAEWDFGGLPSWLLRDQNMRIRSNYEPFLKAVDKYFSKLIPLISRQQFSINGGPVIAVQVENEFASFGNTATNSADMEYMMHLKNLMVKLGIRELLFTSDMPSQNVLPGSLPGVLMTANFQVEAQKELDILKQIQPDKPLMVTEFWSGWFDHWREDHHVIPLEVYVKSLRIILEYGASVNIYMFHGGTNFGFLNGANIHFPQATSPYLPTVTSYDYDALLTEAGDYTEKYFETKKLVDEICKDEFAFLKHSIPLPPEQQKMKIPEVKMREFLPLNKVINCIQGIACQHPTTMEMLTIDDSYGQSFGFILYRTIISRKGNLQFRTTNGTRTIVFLNGIQISVVEWTSEGHKIDLSGASSETNYTLDILVENLGRVNYSVSVDDMKNERRGLNEHVTIDGEELKGWIVYPITFNSDFIEKIGNVEWESLEMLKIQHPIGLYKAELVLAKDIYDAFVYSRTWSKGVLLVNGFNIGRYWTVGPQQTLYLPAPLLHFERNQIVVFELHNKVCSVELMDEPILNQCHK